MATSMMMDSYFLGTYKGLKPRISSSNMMTMMSTRNSFCRAIGGRVQGVSGKLSLSLSSSSSSSSTLPYRKSPWLMVPSNDPLVNTFYSPEEKRVIPIQKSPTTEHVSWPLCLCLGSSHGWLVYENRSNCDLFLFNPISHRIINLPSLYTLPGSKLDPFDFPIKTVILSSSPYVDEDEGEAENHCVAVCVYGVRNCLAFCRPGHDTAWINLGKDSKNCNQIVYSCKEGLFYSCHGEDDTLHCWDLRDPSSPKRTQVGELVKAEDEYEFVAFEASSDELWDRYGCSCSSYLIADPWYGDFLVVERIHCAEMLEDGRIKVGSTFVGGQALDFPYKTVDFQVYKVEFDDEGGVMNYLEQSLGDRALFVGNNQSFSLPASHFPHLRSNSIYFTDDDPWVEIEDAVSYGGHDLGIYNYEDKAFESCYYPFDVKSIKRIVPPPVWLTPDPR